MVALWFERQKHVPENTNEVIESRDQALLS